MSLRLTSLMAVCFQITDPVIEENNRCVVLTGTEFSGAMLMEGKRVNSEGTIPDSIEVSAGSAAVLLIFILIFNFGARKLGSYLHKKLTSA